MASLFARRIADPLSITDAERALLAEELPWLVERGSWRLAVRPLLALLAEVERGALAHTFLATVLTAGERALVGRLLDRASWRVLADDVLTLAEQGIYSAKDVDRRLGFEGGRRGVIRPSGARLPVLFRGA